jgi:hypothetical protein
MQATFGCFMFGLFYKRAFDTLQKLRFAGCLQFERCSTRTGIFQNSLQQNRFLSYLQRNFHALCQLINQLWCYMLWVLTIDISYLD